LISGKNALKQEKNLDHYQRPAFGRAAARYGV
jgi:hypothetical protein